MPLDFTSCRYLVEHAKRRLAELNAEIIAFGNSEPYERVIEPSADGTQDIYKFKLAKPMPFALNGIAFEIATQLRSALDQAGYACAIASGKSEIGGRRIKAAFPFCDVKSELNGRRTGDSRDVPQEIFDVMISFQPYKGGNEFFWALNKLANANKHRIVEPVGTVAGGMRNMKLTVTTDRPSDMSLLLAPFWDSEKNEMILMRMPRGVKPQGEIQFAHYIGFHKIDALRGFPIQAAFHGFVTEVSAILDAIEAEVARIGL